MSTRCLTYEDYEVGWICAMHMELAAAIAMFDERHGGLPRSDENSYVLGRISGHNVVITCLPDGYLGTNSAAHVAAQMMHSFKAIKFGLMVGIGGGVPSMKNDIRLGDIVVSRPVGGHGGVFQYDFGRNLRDGFRATGFLSPPPRLLLSALSTLRAEHHSPSANKISQYLLPDNLNLAPKFAYPGKEYDNLFKAEYTHPDETATCADCDKQYLADRSLRTSSEPQIHYGTIASGNQIMNNAHDRDMLAADHKVLCFEMEAAGLMNNFPCVVIRGISDYSDSHKDKRWKNYAAAAAAAYAKELLRFIPTRRCNKNPEASNDMSTTTAAVWAVADKVADRLCREWTHLRNFLPLTPTLNSRLENVVRAMDSLHYILGHRDFKACIGLSGTEGDHFTSLLKAVEEESMRAGKLLKLYNCAADTHDANGPCKVGHRPGGANMIDPRSISEGTLVTESTMLQQLQDFEEKLAELREELLQLLIRWQSKLDSKFVEGAVFRTHHWWKNLVYSDANRTFKMEEMGKYHLEGQLDKFRQELPSDSPSRNPVVPLSWYIYSGNGMKQYVLVEAKYGPFPKSAKFELENDLDNIRSAYGLVRQFKMAGSESEQKSKFSVLQCEGFRYDKSDKSILLLWKPPVPVKTSSNIPKVATLREIISNRNIDNFRRVIAVRMINTVYELLQARWFHRSISTNNVIAFDGNWGMPYLAGFKTARFIIDGLSDPKSRGLIEWKDRYFQHPKRYIRKQASEERFRMKHDIFSLGILLLELQKGCNFGDPFYKEKWDNLEGDDLRKQFVALAKEEDSYYLGKGYIDPIVRCLQDFERIDRGKDADCEHNVLWHFQSQVLDPIKKL